jgi:peptide/nickel transport system substrate-binding protein
MHKNTWAARFGLAIAIAALASWTMAAPRPAAAQSNVLRVVPQADLRVLDPIVLTAAITRMHAMMVYEELFAWDSHHTAKPMMVGNFSRTPDGLTYTFTLRPGQKWHDGTAVTTADVIASLKRWMSRDVIGQRLQSAVAELSATNADTFVMRLKEPFPFVEYALGSGAASIPVIMREQEAKTDPATAVSEVVGSGPFKFNKSEWAPGSRVVYERNAAYVPRSEAPDGFSGARLVKVDRVEWRILPDSNTAANALVAGEVDFWGSIPNDFVKVLEKSKDVVVDKLFPFDNFALLRANALFPPFDNPKAREALALAVDQREVMQAAVGDSRYWRTCDAYFICGAPYGTEVGMEPYRKPDPDKAKALMKEAGYTGQPVVLIAASDVPFVSAMSQVIAQDLKAAGVNVDLQSSDWGGMITRMTRKDGPGAGGWNLFSTWANGALFTHPLINIGTNMQCGGRNWFGWPCDEQAEALKAKFLEAGDDAGRAKAMDAYHRRLAEVQPYTLLGQYDQLFAWRSNVRGVLKASLPVFWNIEKR